MLVGYDPNEGNGEERERFRNDLDRIVDREGNAYRLCMLGDLKRWNVDRMRLNITGAFQERMLMEEECCCVVLALYRVY